MVMSAGRVGISNSSPGSEKLAAKVINEATNISSARIVFAFSSIEALRFSMASKLRIACSSKTCPTWALSIFNLGGVLSGG